MNENATNEACEAECFFCGETALGVADDGTPTCGGEECEPCDPDFFGEDAGE